jgi:hypothetical protein
MKMKIWPDYVTEQEKGEYICYFAWVLGASIVIIFAVLQQYIDKM